MPDWLRNLMLICAGCYIVPTLIFVIAAAFAFKRGYDKLGEMVMPDAEQMRRQYEALKAANPSLDQAALVNKIIAQQSLKSGILGAITGLGGFVTLPIALPVDIYASMRIQAAMVEIIGYAYGRQPGEIEKRITTYLITAGSERAAAASVQFVVSVTTRFVGKTLSKLIPVIGALTSFGVNYLMTQAIGRAAVERYKRLSQF